VDSSVDFGNPTTLISLGIPTRGGVGNLILQLDTNSMNYTRGKQSAPTRRALTVGLINTVLYLGEFLLPLQLQ
jgi:hypothetical protein